jgi:predicted RNase H-like nuclease (RuvC/YqgF family)
MDQQAKTITINAIIEQAHEIDATKQLIATRREMIDDYIQNKPSWLEVEAAKEELARLRAKLAAELGTDGDYNNMLEDLAQLKDKMKSEKETLSDLVVGYRLETGEHQLEINNDGDARELVLTGRLGKKAKYQPSIFGTHHE